MQRLTICLCLLPLCFIGSDAFPPFKWFLPFQKPKQEHEEQHTCDVQKDATCPEQNLHLPSRSDLKEGDILVPSRDNGITFGLTRTGRRLWTKKTVYYYLDEKLGHFKDMVRSAIVNFTSLINMDGTCIHFKELTAIDRYKEENHIHIKNTEGCYSVVGMYGGEQEMGLNEDVMSNGRIGTIYHELLHALGFYHEQNRYDRHNYVTVQYSNIREKYYDNFRELHNYTSRTHYDYYSIMHYSLYAYAKDREKRTMTVQRPANEQVIGQRKVVTECDREKVRYAYQCEIINPKCLQEPGK